MDLAPSALLTLLENLETQDAAARLQQLDDLQVRETCRGSLKVLLHPDAHAAETNLIRQ